MKADVKQQRRRIMADIGKLELLQEAGGAVDEAEFAELGRQLAALNPRQEVKRRGSRKDALLTKELVAYAKECGTKQGTLYYRVYNLGMDPVKAAEMPTRRKRKTVPWQDSGLTVEKYLFQKQQDIEDREIIERFNISQTEINQFKKVHHLQEYDIRKMAQPKPITDGYKVEYDSIGRRIYPREVLSLAERNAIQYATFVTRVQMGWDYERAATQPARKLNKKGRRAQ